MSRELYTRPSVGLQLLVMDRKGTASNEVSDTVERIREASAILRDLLLRDELLPEESVPLVGKVSEGLDRITVELEQLAGDQFLFELWVG